MGLLNFGAIADAFNNGRYHYQYVHKAATPAVGTAGYFVDLNQTSGTPKYFPFAGNPLEFTPLNGTGNLGVFTGNNHPGYKKYILSWQNLTSTTQVFSLLCDYLAFYPLIDGDNVDLQLLDNPLSLPRYETGEGVRATLIVTAPLATQVTATMTYTNSKGESGKTVSFKLTVGTNIGNLATGGANSTGGANIASPFIPLDSGDTGVRSVESIQLAGASGGFMTLALVKPLLSTMNFEAIPVEKTTGFNFLTCPEIKDNACLNFILSIGNTTATIYRSELIFISA